ncbi:LolA family protein [Trinickia dinghuensis]|uniref:Outer membrane lipoprotein carrier protein LolA n=1 Tax=Trinickia dinghuensis TaxID=2291023 RepID=A0A3D8JSV6_9BURK|nr:outer membrane lipoprotein carrier protein LolA [Trinickia dinghuensis]RDU95756.1 outer membrane lipoprotein carrier protein LolA [Trinickia dinghuensis]
MRLVLASAAACALSWAAACQASASASEPALASAPNAVGRATPARAAASSGATTGAGLVARIAAQLAEKGGVRAQFRQTQTLAALSAPLVSTGSLVFVRDRGVIWRTETPRRVTYVIGDASVATIDANGNRSTHGAPRGGIAQVSRMMRAMLGGDLSALYSQFDVAAEGTPARWRLLLTPNQPQLAQAVKSLSMEGGAFLTALEMTAANGDTTRIDFSGSEPIDALSPSELALFGAR